jgi:hypothetical protein
MIPKFSAKTCGQVCVSVLQQVVDGNSRNPSGGLQGEVLA